MLNEDWIAISMIQTGSPYENALAERINGIIKNEFYPRRIYQNHREAKKCIAAIVRNCNEKRPHASVDYFTPNQAHGMSGEISKRWKHYPYKKSKVKEDPLVVT